MASESRVVNGGQLLAVGSQSGRPHVPFYGLVTLAQVLPHRISPHVYPEIRSASLRSLKIPYRSSMELSNSHRQEPGEGVDLSLLADTSWASWIQLKAFQELILGRVRPEICGKHGSQALVHSARPFCSKF